MVSGAVLEAFEGDVDICWRFGASGGLLWRDLGAVLGVSWGLRKLKMSYQSLLILHNL